VIKGNLLKQPRPVVPDGFATARLQATFRRESKFCANAQQAENSGIEEGKRICRLRGWSLMPVEDLELY
jgi:hypothetical protein